ncbi:carboxysome shell protein [Prochlorococcus marinus XMU1403]|uniref:carboxysome assembly protein CsoS2 n=1 Tax=Prochlorococcus marinus TaxID=1219 RepID=UPI000D995387|nr:CsoS2 family carboxysome shell protein [Prochlorococcus marinus]MBW3049011.1 carboxysome shell protein [Prochlorococcus marinus str. MU1403]PYE01993.1 carboxysome shell protein [Prochlorococcus marinus XMU1403]
MAKQTSRQLVLDRRQALSQGGKNASIKGSTPNRVRSSSDARATRTDAAFVKSKKTLANSNNSSSQLSTSSYQSGASGSSSGARSYKSSVANFSRKLVIERREALSRRGKSADHTKDITRVDVERKKVQNAPSYDAKKAEHCCPECEQKALEETSNTSSKPEISLTLNKRKTDHRSTVKRKAITNSSRAFVLARREALSKHGKSAGKQPTTAASVARQGNPDLTTKEIAQRVRELKSKSGATGTSRTASTRPCGPNKNGAKQNASAPDAHWKVGMSQTSTGQLVTGTQANRSLKTTGNEASTCRSITGTQYLGSEVIDSFCNGANTPISQPAKVAVTSTTHGNLVTGNEVGRSEKVTGDEPGTCKNLTGTEYISANQSNTYCGSVNPSPSKIGYSNTLEGRKVSGTMTGRSELVTGNEAGSGKDLTGDQYLGADPLPSGRPAEKVGSLKTIRGNGVTGTDVSRRENVTGNEAGSCKNVTGDEYVGAGQFDAFCGSKPAPDPAKVGLSTTNKTQSVSGTMTGRSPLVTGDEPGTCKAVTGTPYAGLDQANQWCDNSASSEIEARTPRKLGTPAARLTGQQPGIGGKMTGAHKGACEPLTGTPYVGGDQLTDNCGISNIPEGYAHQEKPEKAAAWTSFSVKSPARQAHIQNETNLGVTGTSYEDSSRITGPFDMAANKVTGTEQFRFDRKPSNSQINKVDEIVNEEAKQRPTSQITGEGQSAGLNITGDDWARGEHVTGTEGASAKRRNPSRPGPMSAMKASELKRNQEVPEPDFLITGSSGNTRDGQLVTFSGGARG